MKPRSLRFLFALLLATAPALRADDYEQRFLDLREAGDRVRIRTARGLDAAQVRVQYTQMLSDFRALVPAEPSTPAAREIARALAEGTLDLEPAATTAAADGAPPDCSVERLQPLDLAARSRELYACYSDAAQRLLVDGQPRDRLTILHELAATSDAARRERLFRALEPLFRSITDDGKGGNPFRATAPLVAAAWRKDSPIERNLVALAMAPERLEPWLVSILEAWRDRAGAQEMEPWDYEYAGSPVERLLGARASRERFEQINEEWHRTLGADLRALNIHYDLVPRAGKTAVAFTDFGARPKLRADGSWSPGEPWVFASYRAGGIGNLNELLHETGHAIHIAAIRTSPAFADWPDSDALTEAIAEVLSQETYESEWQQRWLGASAPLADNLTSRYSGIVLDVAWGLFELRLYADPAREPNAVWNEITNSYLHVRAHPELAWWARRGQLVDLPGYMMNYAIGAILAADLRARALELRGAPSHEDPGYYAWLSQQLFRYGREKSSAAVLRDFLGRAPDPGALLADMRRQEDPAP